MVRCQLTRCQNEYDESGVMVCDIDINPYWYTSNSFSIWMYKKSILIWVLSIPSVTTYDVSIILLVDMWRITYKCSLLDASVTRFSNCLWWVGWELTTCISFNKKNAIKACICKIKQNKTDFKGSWSFIILTFLTFSLYQ